MHQGWDFILQMGKNRNEKIREEAVSKKDLSALLDLRSKGREVTSVWNVETLEERQT